MKKEKAFYFVANSIMLFVWSIYFLKIIPIYIDSIYFIGSEEGLWNQILYFITYYPSELIKGLGAMFLLFLITFYISISFFFYSKIRTDFKNDHLKYISYIYMYTYILFVLFLVLYNKVWLFSFTIIIFSFVISYSIYVLSSSIEEGGGSFEYLEGEVLKKAGPFHGEKEMDEFESEFESEWKVLFEEKGFNIKFEHIAINEEKFIEIYLEKEKVKL